MTQHKPDRDELFEMGRKDLRYLIEGAFYVVNKNSRKVPFRLNAVQNHYWPLITPKDVILKARKMGFSTLRLFRKIAKCMLFKNRRCVVMSHEQKATERLLRRAHDAVDTCAIEIKTGTSSASEISFPDTKSSIWIGTAGQKAFGRGDDVTDYHISEYAFFDNPGLLTGLEEACVNDAEGCIESTAQGWGTAYHKLWQRAETGHDLDADEGTDIYGREVDTDSTVGQFYSPHFYAWFRDPEYRIEINQPLKALDEYERELKREHGVDDAQLAWRRGKLQSMSDPSKFPQEFPATPEEAFLTSGSMVFDANALRKHKAERRALKWRGEIRDKGDGVGLDQHSKGRLRIWLSPTKRHRYIISADVAAGVDDGAYSVADVWDCESREQVAQWHGHIHPDDFGDLLMLLGAFYNWAFLAPEVNNHGLTTCVRIQDENYPKLLIRADTLGGTDLGWFTSGGEGGTRGSLLAAARAEIKGFGCKINSLITIHECMSFINIRNENRPEVERTGPQKGAFSDAVMSLGIGMKILESYTFTPEEEHEGSDSNLGAIRGRRTRRSRLVAPKSGGYR